MSETVFGTTAGYITKVNGTAKSYIRAYGLTAVDLTYLDTQLAASNAYKANQAVITSATNVGGDDTGLVDSAALYTATVIGDAVSQTISFAGSAAQTYTNLLTQINADLTGITATIIGGNVVITHDTGGESDQVSIMPAADSSIVITDSGLFAGLTGIVSVSGATASMAITAGANTSGLANDATAYTASIVIDGLANAVSIVGSASQDIDDVVTQINADLTGATIAISGTDLVVTRDTDLFSSLTGFVNYGEIIGGGMQGKLQTVNHTSTGQTGWEKFKRAVEIYDTAALDVVISTGTGLATSAMSGTYQEAEVDAVLNTVNALASKIAASSL